jgi:hypothetical protein
VQSQKAQPVDKKVKKNLLPAVGNESTEVVAKAMLFLGKGSTEPIHIHKHLCIFMFVYLHVHIGEYIRGMGIS